MSKSKLFHAGRGLWEVRYKKSGKVYGVGYFYTKKAGQHIIRRENLSKVKPLGCVLKKQIKKSGINKL